MSLASVKNLSNLKLDGRRLESRDLHTKLKIKMFEHGLLIIDKMDNVPVDDYWRVVLEENLKQLLANS